MDGLIFLIIVLLGGLITVIGGVTNYLRDKKRREIMISLAAQIGLECYPNGDHNLLRRLSGFKLFSMGRSKKIKNLIFGQTDDETMCLFDFQYTVGSGKQQSTSRQSVIAIESNRLNVPAFNLRPGGFINRLLGGVFGMKDINFEMNPDFSNSQVLKGADEESIRQFFDDRLLRSLSTNVYCIEASRGRMIMYVPKKSFSLEEMRKFMEVAYEMYDKLADRAVVVSN